MALKATCPKDASHKRFKTVATVQETWVVNEYGEYVSAVEGGADVVFEPCAGNVWTCAECGAKAEVNGI
jgi:hypothetical protein